MKHVYNFLAVLVLAGFLLPFQVQGQTGAIAGRVYTDLNLNNQFNVPFGEAGINGVTVQLFDVNNNLVASQVTASCGSGPANQGCYNFTLLPFGRYRLEVHPLPSGFFDTPITTGPVSGGSNVATITRFITVSNAVPINSFIGLTQSSYYVNQNRLMSVIGNRIWRDINRNGIQDPDEQGLGGVTIQLLDSANNVLATTVSSTLSNSLGHYVFDDTNVSGGGPKPHRNYRLRVDMTQPAITNAYTSPAAPAILSPADVGGGLPGTQADLRDSDATLSGTFAIIDLNTGSNYKSDHTFDFGIAPECFLSLLAVNTLRCHGTSAAPLMDVEMVFMYQYPRQSDQIVFTAGSQTLNFTPPTPTREWGLSVIVPNVPVLGLSNRTATAAFVIDNGCTSSLQFDDPTCNLVSAVCGGAGQIGGRITKDFNENGLKDNTDDQYPVSGVTVTAYDAAGTAVATTTSDDQGRYLLTGLTNGTVYRVEFTNIPDNLQDIFGDDSETSVQFVTAPTCNAGLNLNKAADYCHTINPLVFSGEYTLGSPSSARALAATPFNATSNSHVQTLSGSSYNVLGSIWGIAYQRIGDNLFSAAAMRRHSAFTSGTGAIFRTINASSPSLAATSLYVDLTAPPFSQNTGIDPHETTNYIQDVTPTNGASPFTPFDAVGKVAIGDLDISEDGRYLWFVNLNTKQLGRLDIGVPAKPSGTFVASDLTTWTIPNPCNPSTGTSRPWGLGIRDGKVYVGVICDGALSFSINDVTATVYEFNPSSGSFSSILSFGMGYSKGCSYTNIGCSWNAWTNIWNTTNASGGRTVQTSGTVPTGVVATFPQPILSDIDFDGDGVMLLGFSDRFAMQSGYFQPDAAGNNNNYVGVVGGDLLRAGKCGTGGSWVLESNGGSCGIATAGRAGGEGPGGGEFYFMDRFPGNIHREVSQGSMAIVPGTDQTVVGVLDPLAVLSGGLHWYRNNNGDLVKGIEIQPSGPSNTTSKSSSVADLCTSCGGSPIHIGNYVWNDSNGNGVQDPGEAGISGVVVEIYEGSLLIGTTTTNSAGQYYFTNANVNLNGASGLKPNTTYQVRIALSQPAVGGRMASPADVSGGHIVGSPADLRDSDGQEVFGVAIATVTTGTAGAKQHNVDFGLRLPASIGNLVWNDLNGNGVQDAGEPGLSGVVVTLYAADGTTVVASTVTDALGLYQFQQIPSGNYVVGFTPTIGYVFSPTGAGTPATDSDANPTAGPNYGKTSIITLLPGDNDTSSADAGLRPALTGSTIGNFVWLDSNGNGTQDVGEPGISGVVVTLFNSANQIVATTITDHAGAYQFTGVPNGTYTIGVTVPAGYVPTTQTLSTPNGSDVNSAGTTPSFTLTTSITDNDLDAGFVPAPTGTASIGDVVWNDLNHNGIQDAGEPGIAGVTVALINQINNTTVATTTTNAFGQFTMSGVAPGIYRLSYSDLPANFITTLQQAGTDPNLDSNAPTNVASGLSNIFTLNVGEIKTDIDAGAYNNTLAAGTHSITGRVFNDLNANGIRETGDNGLGAVIVTLYASDGTTVIAQTSTDAQGQYSFSNLPNGNYIVGFGNAPAGYTLSPQNVGSSSTDSDPNPSTGRTSLINLSSSIANIDAGYHPSGNGIGNSTITGRAFADINGNGIQNLNEPSLPSVAVTLYAADGVTVLATTTTNALGQYIFTNLTPGTYVVGFGTPSGYAITTPNMGGDPTRDSDVLLTGQTAAITLVPGQVSGHTDAGFTPPANTAVLGNYVWYDTDNNGIQNATEVGVPGVTVTLFDTNGVAVASTTTDLTGYYGFAGIAPGSYRVSFGNFPIGVTGLTTANVGPSTTDSDPDPTTRRTEFIVLTGSSNEQTIDAGLQINNIGGIGDFVWYDTNGNGLQDSGELGIPGVTVSLIDASNQVVGSAVTNANGAFFFPNVTPGNYTLSFSNLPAGSAFTQQESLPATNGSDVNPITGIASVSVTSGKMDTDVDAGLMNSAVSTIGDFVWNDLNGNGIQNGNEPGQAGVLVSLLQGTTVVSVAVSQGSGAYLLNNVPPGNYTLQFAWTGAPTGTSFTTQTIGTNDGSDADNSGLTPVFNLVAGQNVPDLDAGFVIPGRLGSFVWLDADQNGVYNPGEQPLSGITVTLYAADGVTVLATSTTGASGLFYFQGLAPANYIIGFSGQPAGYYFTVQNAGPDDIDSDPDPANGRTAAIAAVTGQYNPTTFAGYYEAPAPIECASFTGEALSDRVLLTWVTASERDNAGFDLQRSSNGVNFETIAFVQSVGESASATTYQYTDTRRIVAGGTYYYRLIQRDYDGQQEQVCNVLIVRMGGTDGFYAERVMPNPTRGRVTLVVHGADNHPNTQVMVFDALGREVQRSITDIARGFNTISLQLDELPAGEYFVRFETTTGYFFVQKVTKSN